MMTTTVKMYFVNKDNRLITRYQSAYETQQHKDIRIFIARVHGYGYGFVVTKLKSK